MIPVDELLACFYHYQSEYMLDREGLDNGARVQRNRDRDVFVDFVVWLSLRQVKEMKEDGL